MPDLFSTSEATRKSRNLEFATTGASFKITTLNVQNFGAKRLDIILEFLLNCDADILVLTEIKRKSATLDLLEFLKRNGYHDTELPDHGLDAYHTIILRSLQGKRLSVTTESLKSRTAVSRITVRECDPIYIVGLYAPTFNEKNTPVRQAFFRDLDKNVLSRLSGSGKNVLLIGDLNMVEASFHNHLPEFVQESKNHISMIARHGFSDVVRAAFPDTPNYTWFSPQTGKGQRLDHVFASASMSKWIDAIDVDDLPRTSGVSDHSAVHVSILPIT